MKTLAELPNNTVAEVASLTSTGAERRRLMDLGIVPGTAIEVEMENPLGDPTAYRIRGSVIALRKEQAARIHITIPDRGI